MEQHIKLRVLNYHVFENVLFIISLSTKNSPFLSSHRFDKRATIETPAVNHC